MIKQLVITFLVLSFLDCGFVELSLKPLWRSGVFQRDAMRWYQILLFGTALIMATIWQDDGMTLEALKFLGLYALWIIAGVEDVLYYFWLPLFERIRGVKYYDEFMYHHAGVFKIPQELPWLGRHTGMWAFTSNWWLYLLSKHIFNNPNVSAWAVLVSAIFVVAVTLRYF